MTQAMGDRSHVVASGDRDGRVWVSRAPDASDWWLDAKAQASYLMCIPEIARAITNRWISEVPSKIV